MGGISARKRIWGWYFFDWASQPYNTLLITFIFAPYIKELIGEGAAAQSAWGLTIGAAGVVIAVCAPVFGAIADASGNRMAWIRGFSLLYVVGAAALWWAAPGAGNLTFVLAMFAVGMIGMEFATIFTNALLPGLGSRQEVGRISGSGWAFGYVGGLVALVIMLTLLAENAATGRTLIGIEPILGLDAGAREGTRAVGPLTAIWYAVFMIPFFAWVRETRPRRAAPGSVRRALAGLAATLARLPRQRSLFAFLGASMFYRDGLNGMYAFGGIYAAGVLGWSVTDVGVFGILAIISGAVFAWLGGRIDSALGPKPVVVACVVILAVVAGLIVLVSPGRVFGVPVESGSNAPDIAFYVLGIIIGAAGGVVQAASRSLMVRQGNPARMTEAFGLYALAGKATSFLAPLSIGLVTALTGSQQLGVTPLIGLFALGLILLVWVEENPRHAQ